MSGHVGASVRKWRVKRRRDQSSKPQRIPEVRHFPQQSRTSVTAPPVVDQLCLGRTFDSHTTPGYNQTSPQTEYLCRDPSVGSKSPRITIKHLSIPIEISPG